MLVKYRNICAAIALWLCFPCYTSAQLIVDNTAPNNSPVNLVKNVLLGNGITVSNITFAPGDSMEQIGYFDGTGSNIGLPFGIIIASGDVNLAVGPNDNSGATLGGGNFGVNDPDLDVISGSSTNDAAVLEFDFVPTGDTVKFRYVFASEEYLEYVGAGFNDAFGFFISGPGINGPYTNNAENIALIPGTATPVSIDNVNDVSNPAYYIDNGDGMSGPQFTDPTVVQFDGFTTVLEAISAVQCGQTYHIKIAIADAGDDILDSGVFLEGGSFSSNNVEISATPSYSSVLGDTILYEGCGNVSVSFKRFGNLSSADTVFILSSGTSDSSDYTALPDTIYFSAGQDSTGFTFTPIDDGLNEGMETLTLEVLHDTTNSCISGPVSITLYIYDPVPIQVNTSDTTIYCTADSILIGPEIASGIPDFELVWDTGDTTDSIYVAPQFSSTYRFTVTDACQNQAINDSISVFIAPPPAVILSASDTDKTCIMDSVAISVQVLQGAPDFLFEWSTGDTNDTIYVSPSAQETYYVTVTDGCGINSGIDSVTVNLPPPPSIVLSSIDTSKLCYQQNLDITTTAIQGVSPFQYLWSTGETTATIGVNPNITTDYYVTVTDGCGINSTSDTITVTLTPPPPVLTASKDDTISCLQDSIVIGITVTSGEGGFQYNWSNGKTTDSTWVSPETTTDYFVTITDTCGINSAVDTVTVHVLDNPILLLTSDTSVVCSGDPVGISVTPAGGNPPYEFMWENGASTQSIIVTPSLTESYVVSVTDLCKEDTAMEAVTVNVPEYPPLKMLPRDSETLHCPGDSILLFASSSGGSSFYQYTWTGWASTEDTLVVNPFETTTYQVEVTDLCNTDTIKRTVTMFVPEYQALKITVTEDQYICPGDAVDLKVTAEDGTGGYTYYWKNINSESDSVRVIPQMQTSYTVEVSDDCGNSRLEIIYVNMMVPEANFNADYEADNRVLFQNKSSNDAVNFWWEFGDGATANLENPEHIYSEEKSYRVKMTVMNQYGCIDTITKEINPPMMLWVPNAFTPAGDGHNEVFKAEGIGIKKFRMMIFNRWGELLFESEHIDNAWNGEVAGRPVPVGTYVYKIVAHGYEGERVEKSGSVNLIR